MASSLALLSADPNWRWPASAASTSRSSDVAETDTPNRIDVAKRSWANPDASTKHLWLPRASGPYGVGRSAPRSVLVDLQAEVDGGQGG
jgi:hypothetical protein